jgi:phenylpyruvate tautomerase PptA (4-oxalocrotonate tautomerase family)
MPHVIVKLWPGKSEAQKQRLADKITEDVMDALNYGDESVSIAFERSPFAGLETESLQAGHTGQVGQALQEARIRDVNFQQNRGKAR